jgi:hypothetical protein
MTDPRGMFGSINAQKGLSPTLDILSSYRRGEIAFADYLIHNAAWACGHLEQYQPRAYPRMSAMLEGYVNRRAITGGEYDASWSRKVGDWAHLVIQIREQNDADLEIVAWSARKCAEIGQVTKAEAALTVVERYAATDFPFDLFAKALRVQKMDADARLSSIKRASP